MANKEVAQKRSHIDCWQAGLKADGKCQKEEASCDYKTAERTGCRSSLHQERQPNPQS